MDFIVDDSFAVHTHCRDLSLQHWLSRANGLGDNRVTVRRHSRLGWLLSRGWVAMTVVYESLALQQRGAGVSNAWHRVLVNCAKSSVGQRARSNRDHH